MARYSAEFKAEAVESMSRLTTEEVADMYGVAVATLERWKELTDAGVEEQTDDPLDVNVQQTTAYLDDVRDLGSAPDAPSTMVLWEKPSGVTLLLNSREETVAAAQRNGWKRVDTESDA